MTVAATGNIGKAAEALQNLLANTTIFKTETESATAAAAKAHIYIGEYTPASAFTRPFAVILQNGIQSEMITAQGFQNSGTMALYLEREIPTDYQDDATEAEMDFINYVDAVMLQCQALSATAGYLLTRSWQIAEGATRIENENTYFVIFHVTWGLAS